MLNKYAVRCILFGNSRTYILEDEHTVDALIRALDHLECDVPEMADAPGLCLIIKQWPEGAHLADEGGGPLIDTTRRAPLALVADVERNAA